MFQLLKSGLPKDPVFPTDLEGLGFFINEDDEVRMISNPRAYFDFFRTKNDRHNCVRRESMNEFLRQEILSRLTKLGLETIRLPLGASETEAHVPILVSANIITKKRVIILFYEHTQDLAVFAYRVAGGRGGINAGSAVNFVKYIQSLSGPGGEESPGIILANLGQLKWWRRGKKAVTQTSWYSLPQTSAAGSPYRFDLVKNTIPGNRNIAEHIAYVFQHVVPELLAPEAALQVIGVSVGAVDLVDFLNKPKNWEALQPRLSAVALVATFHQRDEISNPWFADWLRKRGRAYALSNKPASTPLANSEGNTYTNPEDTSTRLSNCYGCPVFSLGEPHYSELMLPTGYKTILDWFQEVAFGGDDYENPEIVIVNSHPSQDVESEDIDFEEAEKHLVLTQGHKLGQPGVEDDKADTEETNIEDTNSNEWEPANLDMPSLTVSEPASVSTHEAISKSPQAPEPQPQKPSINTDQASKPDTLPTTENEAPTSPTLPRREPQDLATETYHADLPFRGKKTSADDMNSPDRQSAAYTPTPQSVVEEGYPSFEEAEAEAEAGSGEETGVGTDASVDNDDAGDGGLTSL